MPTSPGPFGLTREQKWAAHLVLILLCLPFILPLVWMLSTSFKSNGQIFTGTRAFSLHSIFPWPLRLENYPEAMRLVPFLGST